MMYTHICITIYVYVCTIQYNTKCISTVQYTYVYRYGYPKENNSKKLKNLLIKMLIYVLPYYVPYVHYKNKGKMLEVGCSTGKLLKKMENYLIQQSENKLSIPLSYEFLWPLIVDKAKRGAGNSVNISYY